MPYTLPLVIAHRGASRFLPENTLPAFRLAVEKFHVDMVELDIHTTRDGVPIVLHDAKLERTSNGKGYVNLLNFKELQVLDAGYHFDPEGSGKFPERGKGISIPSLEEVLKEFPALQLAIEIKEKSTELTRSVMTMVEKYRAMDRCVVGSRHTAVSKELSRNFPAVKRFCSQGDVVSLILDFQRGRRARERESQRVASLPRCGVRFRFDTVQWIDFLHERGIPIYFWTINDSITVKSLWIKGADGIVTDDPGLLNQVLGRKF